MTNLPTNLVPTLLRIINDNQRGTIMHDSADVRAVRDMLVIHGCIDSSDLDGYSSSDDYVADTMIVTHADYARMADCPNHLHGCDPTDCADCSV
jgi:hypothetical protein